MPQWAYILIAVAIIVALIIIFFVSYVANKRTPPPKGCDGLNPNDENCAGCRNLNCEFYHRNDETKREED